MRFPRSSPGIALLSILLAVVMMGGWYGASRLLGQTSPPPGTVAPLCSGSWGTTVVPTCPVGYVLECPTAMGSSTYAPPIADNAQCGPEQITCIRNNCQNKVMAACADDLSAICVDLSFCIRSINIGPARCVPAGDNNGGAQCQSPFSLCTNTDAHAYGGSGVSQFCPPGQQVVFPPAGDPNANGCGVQGSLGRCFRCEPAAASSASSPPASGNGCPAEFSLCNSTGTPGGDLCPGQQLRQPSEPHVCNDANGVGSCYACGGGNSSGGGGGGGPDLCAPICGDGQVLGNEECDDGNTRNGDGCSATCRRETGTSSSRTGSSARSAGSAGSSRSSQPGLFCGNGIQNPGEQCGEPGLQCTPGIACGGGALAPGGEYNYALKFNTNNVPCGTTVTNTVKVTGKLGGTTLSDTAVLTTVVECGGGSGSSAGGNSSGGSTASAVSSGGGTVVATCFDSDLQDVQNAGYIITNGTRMDDVCAQDVPPTEFWTGSPGAVLEMICLGPTSPFRRQMPCPNGFSCANGACTAVDISTGTCTDTDGGIEVLVRGSVSNPAEGGSEQADSCSTSDPTVIIERYCRNSRFGQLGGAGSHTTVSAQIRCPEGMTCQNGACQ